MTTYYNQGGDWSVTDIWNTAPDGSGTPHTYTVAEPGNTYDLNDQGVTLDMDVTIAESVSNGSSGVLNVNASHTFNGNMTCTNGIILQISWGTLTINGKVSTSGSCSIGLLVSSGASVVVNNPGGVAFDVQKGTGLSISGGGGFTVVGAINVNAASAYGIQTTCTGASSVTGVTTLTTGTGGIRVSGATPLTVTGAIIAASGSGMLVSHASAVVDLVNCSLKSTPGVANCYAINQTNGIVNWSGAATLAAGEECYCQLTTGTVNFGTAGSAFTLSNSGEFSYRVASGTFDGTYGTVNNVAATGQATFPGASVKPTVVPFSSGCGLAVRIGEAF